MSDTDWMPVERHEKRVAELKMGYEEQLESYAAKAAALKRDRDEWHELFQGEQDRAEVAEAKLAEVDAQGGIQACMRLNKKLQDDLDRLREVALEVWNSVPATYDERSAECKRHATALNALRAECEAGEPKP